MHFHAGKSHDVLDRAEQVRLAAVLGYQGTEGLLPVEQFMREYFRHTRAVSNLVGRFSAQIRALGADLRVVFPRVRPSDRGGFHRRAADHGHAPRAGEARARLGRSARGWPIWRICTTSGSRRPRGRRSTKRLRSTPISSLQRRRGPISFAARRSRSGSASCCASCTSWACWKKSCPTSPMPAACCNSTNITSSRSTSIACGPSTRRRNSCTTRACWASVYRGIKQKRTLAPGAVDPRSGQRLCRRPQRSRAANRRAHGPAAAACRGARPKRSSSWFTSICSCRIWRFAATRATIS